MKKLTVLILTLLILSCNKKDDPQPTQTTPPTGTTTPPTTTTNTPPTVSATPSSATNPTTITINATDSDGTISKVEVFNGSTLLTTLTTSPYIYTLPTLANGSYTYTVKATDNSNAVSSTSISFTVSVSVSSPKTDTETILSGFMNKNLSKVGGNGQYIGPLLITSTTMSATQAQCCFFGAITASGTYTVSSSGYVILNSAGIITTYSVSSGTKNSNPTLILTDVNNASGIYVFQ